MAGKYGALRDHLSALSEAGSQVVEFDFADIAALVGELPPTAYSTRQWWGNDSKVEAQAWRDADWHVAMVDFERQRVRFERGRVGGGYQARGRRPAKEKVAAVFAVETSSADLDVRVNTTWERVGDVVLDENGGLEFPALPNEPAVYRMTMSGVPGQERPSIYVGETQDIKKRAYGYRRPTPRQQTSFRMNNELVEHLGKGGRVVLAVARSATIEALGESKPLPLGRQTARVLVEHAALALIYLDESAVVMNKDRGAD